MTRLLALTVACLFVGTYLPIPQVFYWSAAPAEALPSRSRIEIREAEDEDGSDPMLSLTGVFSGQQPLWKAFWILFVCGAFAAIPASLILPVLLTRRAMRKTRIEPYGNIGTG